MNALDIDSEMNLVNNEIELVLKSKDEKMQEILDWVVSTKGKQLRPKMMLWTYHYQDIKVDDQILKYAAAIEIVHIASLVHDDVIDDGKVRRGKESVQSKYGKKMAVYAGDYMIFSLFESLYSIADENYSFIIESLNDVCYGELSQNANLYNLDISKDEYIKNIYGKTAVAFEVACKAGAVGAKLKAEEISAFSNYGKNFGILFQVRDDLLDLQNNSSEKTGFIDFAEGIYTLPIIIVANNAEAKETLRLLSNDLKNGESTLKQTQKNLINVLCKYEWKKVFFNIVDEYYEDAKKSLCYLQECDTVTYFKNILDKIKKDIYEYTEGITNM